MNEKEYKELLEEVKSLRNQISRLTRRLEFYEYLFRRYGFPPFPPWDEEEFDKWIKTHKEEIRSISRIFKEHEISPQDATFYLLRQNFRMTLSIRSIGEYLAFKSLLGSCECGGQLQLLVKDNTVYLTCAKCGRWLWQGLKHE